MKLVALVAALLAAAASSARADMAVYSSPNGSFVLGAYKTLHKAKHVRRQITPGGNLVRAIIRSGTCTSVRDPYATSWSCAATVTGKFRAEGQVATSETQVAYEWDAAQQRLTVTSDAAVVSFGSGNNFATGVEVQRGGQSFVAAIGVGEVVPSLRCRAFYAMSATSDVSPVRVFDAQTRLATLSRVACE